MKTAEQAAFRWLTRAECMARLECGEKAFQMMVADGLIHRRTVPGTRRYWREDVERLASPPPAA
jgi:hypothetical protein